MTTPSQLRQTRTVVVLGISQAAFDEISQKLRAAGYDHVFMPDGEIDMSGIAVAAGAEGTLASVTVPAEPTQAMLDAADKVLESDPRLIAAAWRAMVAASGVAGRNNCATCDHKKHPDGGHCYMFRTEPEGVCMKHTARANGVLGTQGDQHG